jgi:hypothetical protein
LASVEELASRLRVEDAAVFALIIAIAVIATFT